RRVDRSEPDKGSRGDARRLWEGESRTGRLQPPRAGPRRQSQVRPLQLDEGRSHPRRTRRNYRPLCASAQFLGWAYAPRVVDVLRDASAKLLRTGWRKLRLPRFGAGPARQRAAQRLSRAFRRGGGKRDGGKVQ